MNKAVKRNLILGIGNTLITDDGIGIRIAEEIGKRTGDYDIKALSISGLYLLDEIDGYDNVYIIDSMKTGKYRPGTVRKLENEELKKAMNLDFIHNINFPTALKLGDLYYDNIPKKIEIFAVEILDNTTISESCSPELEEKIPAIADKILDLICMN